jgi:hypothetical protein
VCLVPPVCIRRPVRSPVCVYREGSGPDRDSMKLLITMSWFHQSVATVIQLVIAGATALLAYAVSCLGISVFLLTNLNFELEWVKTFNYDHYDQNDINWVTEGDIYL